jgi:hypothetical protein
MTAKQLEILQHAFGVDRYGQGEFYRNNFCAGGEDVVECKELVKMGFMASFEREWLPYFNCTVTEAGKKAMIKESPEAPLLTKGQRRYREFLKADTGRSFGEWLRDQAVKHDD